MHRILEQGPHKWCIIYNSTQEGTLVTSHNGILG